MNPTVTSAMKLSQWRGDITIFNGYFDTTPQSEYSSLTWDGLTEIISGNLKLTRRKENAPYFVPCLLTNAPLIGKTLEKAAARGLPLEGKQRSSSHTTVGSLLVADIDGIDKDEWESLIARLDEASVAYAVYSTYSYGNPEKPGIRARILFPIDKSLGGADYARAWMGLEKALLHG